MLAVGEGLVLLGWKTSWVVVEVVRGGSKIRPGLPAVRGQTEAMRLIAGLEAADNPDTLQAGVVAGSVEGKICGMFFSP